MGVFTFKWEHPAEEVYVTGTFDNWTKSVKLDKEGELFSKSVELPEASSKIYYKFVVDNNWTTNASAPIETDPEGNVNNFLTPEQILPSGPAAAVINTVTPESTTAKMAGEQPKETVATPSDLPGGFPATPADELDKPVSVNPLPASAGAVNPITLLPGEPIPDAGVAGNVNDNVKLDKESYEKSDALPGAQSEVPATSKSIIPESGIPVGVETLNSVTPGSTTAALAGQVPKEPKVPEVVKESQAKAGAEPEASAVPEEVREKAEVEEELKEKVPEAPATSEGTSGVGTEKRETTTPAVAAAATAGGAVLAAAIAAKDTIVEKATPVVNQATTAATGAAQNLPDSVKSQLPVSTQEAIATENKELKREEVSPEVPTEVKESIAAAGESPEAAANTEAVKEKEQVEAELLKEIKPVPEASEAKTETAKAAVEQSAVEQPKVDAAKIPDPAHATEAPKATETPATTAPAAATEETKPANGTGNGASNGAGNGTSSKPAAGDAGSTAATETTAEKKKRHRVSAFFSKIKSKLN